MAKTIWLRDGVYIALDAVREKRETFSQAVERLIKVYLTLKDVSDTLGPGHYLKEHPLGGKSIEETPDRRGNCPTLPNVPIH